MIIVSYTNCCLVNTESSPTNSKLKAFSAFSQSVSAEISQLLSTTSSAVCLNSQSRVVGVYASIGSWSKILSPSGKIALSSKLSAVKISALSYLKSFVPACAEAAAL